MAKPASKIRREILDRYQLDKGKSGHLTKNLPVDSTGQKTKLMRYIEKSYRKPIEEIIWSKSALEVAKELDLPHRTVYNWRLKFPKEVT